ncbi:sporulation-delaying protein SdpB family protein [Leifsonia sp. L25]|uniref:sporulation-delaying protein SdpB family protein n=1 Tax=Actinomycetes TaxID=1760 RepID=UPI003D684D3A
MFTFQASIPFRIRASSTGRTLIALAQLSIIVLTPPAALLQPVVGQGPGPLCDSIRAFTLYCIGGDVVSQEWRRWIMVVLLCVIASGWRPRWTSVPHAWICLSLGMSISLPDGGDQVARIVGLLLIPLALVDDRRWHWGTSSQPLRPFAGGAASAFIIAIRIQVAAIYLNSAIAKFGTDAWVDGSAEYYYVRSLMFGASGWIGAVMLEVTKVPLLVASLTWGAIVIEIAIAVLILGPAKWRRWAVLADLLLHGFIVLTIGLWSFAGVMVGTVLIAASASASESSDRTSQTIRERLWRFAKSLRVRRRSPVAGGPE